MLSGGGARGLAHVRVLKVLERERAPVDAIVRTSMGAIIGGLYGSGMKAADQGAELTQLNWDAVFALRVDRQHLSQRRKEEDFEISPVIEIRMNNGEFRVPLGALSGRGLESLLLRFTLPVRGVTDFDKLPIPFRALATDMESGQPVVLSFGDLALALRSSMSVRFEGSTATNPKRFEAQLESAPGQPFDPARAERDARRPAASGDCVRAGYQLVSTSEGDGQVFDLGDKPLRPLHFGLTYAPRGAAGVYVFIGRP